MTLGELIIRIKADVAGAQAGFMKVNAGLATVDAHAEETKAKWAGMQSTINKGALIGAAVIGVAAVVVDKAVKGYDQYAAGVEQLTKVSGMSTKQASLLTAENLLLTGSTSVNAMAVKTFTSNLGKAQEGGKAQLKQFADLGITLKDSKGHWLDIGTVWDETRTKMSEMTNTAQRGTAMTALFGRGAVSMAKYLTLPQAELDKLDAKIKTSGAVLDDARMKQYHQFEIAQNTLKGAIGLLGLQIAQGLLPVLTKLTGGVTWLLVQFNKLPGFVKEGGAAFVLAAAGAAALLWVVSKMIGVYGTITGFIAKHTAAQVADTVSATADTGAKAAHTAAEVADAGAATANTGALAANTLAEEANGMGAGAAGMALEARTAFLIGDTTATEANTVAEVANSRSMMASLGLYGLIAAGIAVDIVLVDKAVRAYQAMRQAIDQAAEAARNAQSALNKAPDAAFQTNNPKMASNQSRAQIQSEIHSDSYKPPWYNPFTWASGVDTDVTKPTYALIGEAGPEHVTVTPAGKSRPGMGDLTVNISIGNVNGTDEQAARSLAERTGQILTQQIRMANTRRNA